MSAGPSALLGRSTRHQRRIVLILLTVSMLRGLFWAVASIAPSPVDEMQHFDYVRSIAVGDGVPTVGEDHLAPEVLRFAKTSPTFGFRSYPYPGDLSGPTWVGADPQYEGIQGPTYYALLAPFYWLGRPWGTDGSFYAIRFGSVLLGALSIPAIWLLTRRLLPGRPSAWILPPLLLTFVNAVTAGPATIGNDTLVLTGTAFAALALLVSLERRTTVSAVGAGMVAGLVLLGKTTALAMIPVFLLLAWPSLRSWWSSSPERRAGLLRWVAGYGVAFGTPFAIWTAWNLVTYHAISGAAEADLITGPLQTSYPRSLETLRLDLASARVGVWAGQLANVVPGYHHIWEVALLVVIAVAIVVAWRRRQTDELRTILWGASSYPIAFLTIAGFFMLALGDSGLLLGRYIWVALIPTVVAFGVALDVVFPRRVGVAAALVLVSIATWHERSDSLRFVRSYYETDLAGDHLAPVVDQSWNDRYVHATEVRVDVACSVSVVDVGFQDPPAAIKVSGPASSATGHLEHATASSFARYRLDHPVTGPITIPVSAGVAVSSVEREPAAALVGGAGDPMVRAHCPVSDPGAVRFPQLYDPTHPTISRRSLRAWPTLMAAATSMATACAIGWALLGLRRRPPVGSPRFEDADPVS
jgi:hypothetical protein